MLSNQPGLNVLGLRSRLELGEVAAFEAHGPENSIFLPDELCWRVKFRDLHNFQSAII